MLGLRALWQPIEEGKKDGRDYLLFWRDEDGQACYEVGFWGADHSEVDGWIEGRDLCRLPATHFAELEAPYEPRRG